MAFDGTNTKLSSELLTSSPASDGSRVNYSTNVSGLTNGPFYHWRLRVLAPRNPLFPSTMWMNFASVGLNEQSLKTSCTVITWYPDNDGDGYGDPAGPTTDRCNAPAGHVANSSDCNDGNPNVNPGQSEQLCDAVDNDCSPGTPDAPDADGDTYDVCDPADPGDTDGKIADCADGDPSINPGEDEIECDGIDNDCFPSTEDAADRDFDGADVCEPTDPGDTDGLPADCDDFNPQVSPGHPEHTCTGVDENCNGMQDDAPDDDGDGYDICEPEESGDTDGLAADCDPFDSFLWTVPGEVTDLNLEQFAGVTYVRWTAPTDAGGLDPLLYDTVRTNAPDTFGAGDTCVEENGTDLESTDAAVPPAGTAYYYLSLAGNGCGRGSAGTNSTGSERVVLTCTP